MNDFIIDKETTKFIRMSIIFNEWSKRALSEPEVFEPFFNDENGKITDDYGDRATYCFMKIAFDLEEKGMLPK